MPAGEHEGGEEHHYDPEHHGPVVSDPVNDGARDWVDQDLNCGLRGEENPDPGVLPFVLYEDALDVDLLGGLADHGLEVAALVLVLLGDGLQALASLDGGRLR